MPQSVGIESTMAVSRAIDQKLRAEPLIRRVDWTVGESPPAFYYNLRSNRQNIPGWAEAMVLTTDENKTDALIRRLQRELDRDFPQAQILVLGIDQGPPVDAPVEVVIYGPDTDTLKQLGDAFRQRLQSLPDITHTKVSISPAAPKIEFTPDTAKLRLVGLQETDIALFINQSLRGLWWRCSGRYRANPGQNQAREERHRNNDRSAEFTDSHQGLLRAKRDHNSAVSAWRVHHHT